MNFISSARRADELNRQLLVVHIVPRELGIHRGRQALAIVKIRNLRGVIGHVALQNLEACLILASPHVYDVIVHLPFQGVQALVGFDAAAPKLRVLRDLPRTAADLEDGRYLHLRVKARDPKSPTTAPAILRKRLLGPGLLRLVAVGLLTVLQILLPAFFEQGLKLHGVTLHHRGLLNGIQFPLLVLVPVVQAVALDFPPPLLQPDLDVLDADVALKHLLHPRPARGGVGLYMQSTRRR
jgi:hypothetical protein